MPTLTVHNAEIRTASVEVKTLTISGKQVTQSVFKQLPSRDLISADGYFNGEPWGRVNYHPDKCSDDKAHLHVVWEQGKELFRANVSLTLTYPRWFEAKSGTAWVDAKVREDVSSTLIGFQSMKDEFTKTFLGISVNLVMSHEARMVTAARESLVSVRRDIAAHGPDHRVWAVGAARAARSGLSGLSAARAAAAAPAKVPAASALATLEGELEKRLAALPNIPIAEAESQLLTEVQAEVNRRKRRTELRNALVALPQLFIAV